MRKYFLNFFKRIAQFNIIMGKTTLSSIELIEDLDNINKTFKDKIEDKK